MKHGTLRSVAHNLADSLASGCCLMIENYEADVFGEAARLPNGVIAVDFLRGTVTEGNASTYLSEAVRQCGVALGRLCNSQGISRSAFRRLSARFVSDTIGRRFSITIEDEKGRATTTDYQGVPGKRVKVLDSRGRLRPKLSTLNSYT